MREVVVSGRRLPLPPPLVRRVVTRVLEGERRHGLISVTFLGRDAMRRMNAEHKGRDLPTDVLAFAMTDGTGQAVGDVETYGEHERLGLVAVEEPHRNGRPAAPDRRLEPVRPVDDAQGGPVHDDRR